jgi:large subunit ribosomal protein L19
MNAIIEKIEKSQMKDSLPELEIGSTLKLSIKIEEEGKERVQVFTGLLIAKKGSGLRETITLRRATGGYPVERIFFLHSPMITSIELIRRGKVRRAKLYYLRDKVGKAAKIVEKK